VPRLRHGPEQPRNQKNAYECQRRSKIASAGRSKNAAAGMTDVLDRAERSDDMTAVRMRALATAHVLCLVEGVEGMAAHLSPIRRGR